MKDMNSMDLLSVQKHLIDFIRVEVRKAGFQKCILGISGGVDSALVAYLAAGALGKDNLTGVLMPYKTSSPESTGDAMLIVETIGIKWEKVDITPMVDAYLSFDPEMDNLRRGNIMARQRMIVLYDISARERALVLGTSNKTEILLGYGTLFGDTACALNPVGNLYKTDVWALAESMGVPKRIIEKKPTADLWAGQTDEEELGFQYRHVDKLLRKMVDKSCSDEELMKQGFEKAFIANVKDLIRRNEFKSKPPLIAKLPPNV